MLPTRHLKNYLESKMSTDYQAKYNAKNTQYKNALKQIDKLKEEIQILKSPLPPRLVEVQKEIVQTPVDKILDSKEIDDKIEQTKLELDEKDKVEKDHNYYRQISSMMYNEVKLKAQRDPKVYRQGWFNLSKNFWKWHANTEYSEKQKDTMDGWIERNGITI